MPEFAFAIPLMPKAAAADWELVQRNLRRTISSALLASEGHSASIYVACHDEPDLADTSHEKVHVRSVPFPPTLDPTIAMRDRSKKRRFIGAWLREHISDSVFVTFLDADDLVHRNIVSHTLSNPAGSYFIDEGFLMDAENGLLLRRSENYYLTCGSSFICRFTKDELPQSWEDEEAPFSLFGAGREQGHHVYPEIAADLGRPSERIPFAAGVYVVNHGENHWTTVKGRKRKMHRPSDIVSPVIARRILETDFAAHDLAAQISGRWGVAKAFAGHAARTARARTARLRVRARAVRRKASR